MKAIKSLFLAIFFLTFAAGTSYGQSEVTTRDINMGIRFICDGVVNIVIGPATLHQVVHFNKDGNVDWVKNTLISDELQSIVTGEIFRVNRIYKIDMPDTETVVQRTLHYNLVGDDGTHVLHSETWELDVSSSPIVWTLIKEETKCL